MRSFKRRVVLDQRPCPWLTLDIGTSVRCLRDVEYETLISSFRSFTEKLIKATKGEKGIVEPTYVYLPGVSGGDSIAKETGVDYFSVPVELGVRFSIPTFLVS